MNGQLHMESSTLLWRRVLLFAALATLAFLPLALAIHSSIWPPAAMVHEMFGYYFVALYLLPEYFYYMDTGHFPVVVGFLINLLLDAAGATSLGFERYREFSLWYYALMGFASMAILVAGVRRLRDSDLLALAVALFLPPLVLPLNAYDLIINYDRIERILFAATALVVILRLRGAFVPGPTSAMIIGIILGLAFSTKYTFIVLLGPLLLLAILDDCRRTQAHHLVWAAGAASITTVLVYSAFFQFKVEYFHEHLRLFVEYYQMGWYGKQRIVAPFFADAIAKSFDPRETLFGLALLLLCWAGVVIHSLGSADSRMRALLIAMVPGVTFLGYQLSVRYTFSTFMDAACFVAASLAMLCSMPATPLRRTLVPLTVVVGVALNHTLNPPFSFEALVHNSLQARNIEDARRAFHGPSVLYVNSLDQRLLFPFAPVYPLFRNALGSRFIFMNDRFPGFQLGQGEKPLTIRHLMIVPQYLRTLPESQSVREQQPTMLERVDPFERYPPLARLRDASECRQFQFEWLSTRPLFLWQYPVQVTLCVTP